LDVQAYLRDMVLRVDHHPLIHVYTDAAIVEATGYVGNFVTKVRHDGRISEIKHGATIIATGANEYRPAEYLYGQDAGVLTQLELEEHIARADEAILNTRNLVMIQCVGCRQEDRNYCARICCSHAIKNALKLKEINSQMDIFILFRDMRPYGYREDYYRAAAEKHVRFIRYEPQEKPQVEAVDENGRHILRVTVPDPVLGTELILDADAIALSAAIVPSDGSKETAALFKVTLNPDGFFQEAHVKLRPVDFGAEGVYLCGTAHYPKHIAEAVSQAYGAAGRALTLLSHDTVTASGSVCIVNESECISCGACISACTYGAIEFYETAKGKKAKVTPVLCKGDGLCNTMCPTGAIALKHYLDEAILDQIDAAAPETYIC
jgi:heterodisulfide reductase subunit A